jgi:D-alanyl-lipoteichoic acid acyltransferase DltB (MBOAT superfamily)
VYLLDSSPFFAGPAAEFILPIGISFFTLQSMGYTIDVYRGKKEAETHFGLFALYVAYFPQLIAGPIERANKLLPQLKSRHYFDWERIRSGGMLILVGLFKKLVIVGSLSPLMDSVFSENANYTWFEAVLAASLSMFYIYMDFSAYTDIARGSARIYGVNLTENFNRPLGALSVRDFWQRWHMSLTKWIFDYLHHPLSTLFRNTYWRRFAQVLTFSIVGLWHGAAVSYVLWGFANGVIVLVETLFAQWKLTWPKTKLWNCLRHLRTLFLVNATTVVFLSPSIEHATAVFRRIFSFDLSRYLSNSAMTWPLVIAAISIFSWYFVCEYLAKYQKNNAWPPRNTLVRWACYLILILSIVNFSAPDQNAFIYFKF